MNKGRKISGGKYKRFKKTKKYERAGIERKVILKDKKSKVLRGLGGNLKTVLLSENYANIIDLTTKQSKKAKIINVLETPANRFLARQNRLIKSAIIETELGKAKITNRPGQEGNVQAVLIK